MSNSNENATIADLKEQLRKTQRELEAVLELATYLQDDYSIKLPVVAAFRQWRGGHLGDAPFLARLCGDDLAPALRYEKCPPMEGLAILSRYRNRLPPR